MVTAVHSRGDNQLFYSVLYPKGYSQVAVVKLGSQIEKDVECHQSPKRGSPEENHQPLRYPRKNQFSNMEPRRSRNVNLHIAVMGPVKPPQETEAVIGPVHPVVP